MPPPFTSRVRNALNAEARSVKLSNLVGQGGLWYGFGRMVMNLCVSCLPSYECLFIYPFRLDDSGADDMSNMLVKVFLLRIIALCAVITQLASSSTALDECLSTYFIPADIPS